MILDSRGAEVNGNGVDMTERQKAKYMLQAANIGEVNEIAHAHAVQAMNHLGNQIPALLKTMIEEAVTAALNGYHQSLVERGVIPVGDSPTPADCAESRPAIEAVESPETLESTEPIPGVTQGMLDYLATEGDE